VSGIDEAEFWVLVARLRLQVPDITENETAGAIVCLCAPPSPM
jgi:hypothetical protein